MHLGGTKNLEVCGLIRLAAPGTPFMWIYEQLKNLTNGILHQCPYHPRHFELYNFTTDIKDYKFLMKGDYRINAFLRDDIDTAGGNLSLYYSLIVRGGEFF